MSKEEFEQTFRIEVYNGIRNERKHVESLGEMKVDLSNPAEVVEALVELENILRQAESQAWKVAKLIELSK